MLVTPQLGMPLALLPLQILWVNEVADGLPALAIGVEPPEPDTMRRPPHRPGESIFARGLGRHVVWVGILMRCLTISVGYWYWHRNRTTWRTMLFTTLTLLQMAHVLAIRSEHISLFRLGLLSNKFLLAAVCSTILLQLALIYWPSLQNIFHTVALVRLILPWRSMSLARFSVLSKWRNGCSGIHGGPAKAAGLRHLSRARSTCTHLNHGIFHDNFALEKQHRRLQALCRTWHAPTSPAFSCSWISSGL